MSYLNGFSVRIIGGNEIAGNYVEMRDKQTYRISLHNSREMCCDAKVEIDGKEIGTWRLNPHQNATLEHPANDEGKFTFYRLGTSEAYSAQLDANSPDLGLVKVTFTPEVYVKPIAPTWTYTSTGMYNGNQVSYRSTMAAAPDSFGAASASVYSSSPKGLSSGGTGLSGHSDQVYGVADSINYDYSQQSVIYLRLVSRDNDAPRPLTQLSTPIPPRVG